MRPIEARSRETREWLGHARSDLASAGLLFRAGHLANALFFCQQAAEKGLKGFLTWHDQPFRRTHDLEELGASCCGIDGTLSALMDEADTLSDYAWKLRYPGAGYIPAHGETDAMLQLATRVVDEIEARLSLP